MYRLEEDVSRFDAFLQSNDAKAHKAMKTAEDLTKKKQEKMQRIKQLKSQTSAIHSEISKHREQKEECEKYKKFLEDLTPQVIFTKQTRFKKLNANNNKKDAPQISTLLIKGLLIKMNTNPTTKLSLRIIFLS